MHQEKHTPSGAKFRVAVSPLSWTNDVLEDLGNETTLEQCLREAATAGYAGVELGRKFPREPEVLGPILERHRLALASGWYSGFLAERDVATEIREVAAHATLLKTLGAKVMVYGECGAMAPESPLDVGMSTRRKLSAAEMSAYANRLSEFAKHQLDTYGVQLAYHHHLMMVAETFDEICALFDRTTPAVGLLLDTGHCAAAGFDYRRLIERYGERIVHIHLKDVRADVMRDVRGGDLSFNTGVRNGMFTIPGDGSVDYSAIADFVRRSGYAGWLVVEAEQDPEKAPPLATVTRARHFIDALFA
ncbi:MAG: myo-inosose-2 dehydratase [Propionivibrio sp.]